MGAVVQAAHSSAVPQQLLCSLNQPRHGLLSIIPGFGPKWGLLIHVYRTAERTVTVSVH